jgi:hypothetical protein
MYGKCFNSLCIDEIGTKRCIHGVHLTEKNLISYYQRVPLDLYSNEFNIFSTEFINYNIKNNIISLVLNDETVEIVKELISNKTNKLEIIKNYNNKKHNLPNCINNVEELNELLDEEEIKDLFGEKNIENRLDIVNS